MCFVKENYRDPLGGFLMFLFAGGAVGNQRGQFMVLLPFALLLAFAFEYPPGFMRG
jgi:hypothetical protein